jgi:hypothetical protein
VLVGERRDGTLALGAGGLGVDADGVYVLNTGGAYGGELHISGAITLRLADGELPLLREHDRSRLVGVWTGARVDGRRVVATGLRWGKTPDALEVKSLFDDKLLRAASIGFSATWTYASEVKPEEKERLAREEGADLARLQYVLTNVEVYEASLVAVGADAGARWGYAPGEESGTLGDGRRVPAYVATTARHLVDHHGLTAEQAAAWLLGQQVQAIVDAVEEPAESVPEMEPEEEGDDTEEAALAADDGALFDVPSAIAAAAQQGLDWREEYGRGGTASGVRTARALVSGRVEPELLITIAAWWARFSAVEGPMEGDDGEPTALAIARALWGGDEAQAWADARVDDARREVDGEMSAVADAPVSADLSAWWAASPPAPDPLSAWWTGTAGSDPLHR